MKPKTLMLLVVAIGCGLVAAYLTAKLGAVQAPQGEEKLRVLVVKKDIPAGQLLKDPQDWVEYKEVPKVLVPKNSFEFDPKQGAGDEEDQIKKSLSGQVTLASLSPPAILQKSHLNSRLGIDPRPGWEAVALKVDAEKVAGGFVQPKSRVNLLFTCQMANGRIFSDTILKNVLVLAVDQHDARPEEGKRTPPATVTMEMTPDQSKLLNWGRVKGQLSLGLRSSANSTDKEGECKSSTEWEKEIAKAQQEENRDGPRIETQKVLIAKKEILPGTIASRPEELFEVKDAPKELLKNTAALSSFDQVKGKTIYKHLYQGWWTSPKHLENDGPDQSDGDDGFTQTVLSGATVSVYKSGVLVARYELGTSGAKDNTPTKGDGN